MRAPLSWIRTLTPLPADVSGREVAARLIAAGLEVETVESVGGDVQGPLVVGRVRSVEELTEFRKPIRYCRVEVGAGRGEVVDGSASDERGVICGARNFLAGDLVVVALPGAVLPGGLEIASRQTYGRLSDGMIASERELGLGVDHSGIIVLPEGSAAPGDDGAEVLGLGEEILDIAVTPDRGYALSIRGIAREVATAFDLPFDDPALVDPESLLPAPASASSHECRIVDPTAADRFVLRAISGLDPLAPSPQWMRRALVACGMRPVSLAVDVTNYVMLELGQPLHAFDRATLDGALTVRRARPGERLETLDHVVRALDPGDVLIADDRRPLGLAGTMGGLESEISEASRDVVIEAVHFDAVSIARMSRRHRLSSEASRRFERGVDPELPAIASARAAALLVEIGGARYVGTSRVDAVPPANPILIPVDLPSQVSGLPISQERTIASLEAIGALVDQGWPRVEPDGTIHVTTLASTPGTAVGGPDPFGVLGATWGDRPAPLHVLPPSWRPDLTDPADLVEEVVRLVGYESLPSRLPRARAGFGLTSGQRLRRRIGRTLSAAGLVEVLTYPFLGAGDVEALGLPDDDPRRDAVRLANPLSDEAPLLRTTLLPGLAATARRNLSRGAGDLALYEVGLVVRGTHRPGSGPGTAATVDLHPSTSSRPSPEQLQDLDGLLPQQPRHVAGLLTGDRDPAGWWGGGRGADWSDALGIVVDLLAELGVPAEIRSAAVAPWHPGRCAEVVVAGAAVGHAGELHPRVVSALGLPPRTCAFELAVDPLLGAVPPVAPAPQLSTMPVAKEDLAVVVAAAVGAEDVRRALLAGGGELLESVRLFDSYTGDQVAPGHKSLAFALRLRADDRTLSAADVAAVREAALAEAARVTGARLRS